MNIAKCVLNQSVSQKKKAVKCNIHMPWGHIEDAEVKLYEFWTFILNGGGHVAVYLVEALRYKKEGRRFDSNEVTGFFNCPNPSSPGVDSASNRNENQESSWG
jgi:hypothetical protein